MKFSVVAGLFTLYAGSAVLCPLVSVGLFYAQRAAARQPADRPIPVLVEG
ncbi:hypothetical protein GCM10023063_43200 [Arthrobacter methylotrophus]|uniref:Uncharacterized protein n=1 Tax=Arthrobacter methylotrophus TaxID=121291 RepID=A0ABV5UMU8_9MICC